MMRQLRESHTVSGGCRSTIARINSESMIASKSECVSELKDGGTPRSRAAIWNRNVPLKTVFLSVLLLALASCKESPNEPQEQEPAPQISISVVPDIGTVHTAFEFHLTIVVNGDTVNGQGYRVRWDWDGDGSFDTQWLDSLTAEHLYSELGRKAPEVQVQSPSGNTYGSSSTVYVQETIPILTPQSDELFEEPDWSRDGTNRIAFSYRLGSHGWLRLAILHYPQGTFDIVTPDGTESYLPEWSGDGKKIAFSTRGGLGILDVVSGVRTIFPPTFDQRPSWSPGGRYIVYGTLLYDLADSSTSSFPFFADVGWSPDGNRMALISYGTLTIVAFPGYAVLQQYQVPGGGFKVEWSPNGRWISLGGGVLAPHSNFYLFDLASTRIYSWRADGIAGAEYPTWSGDGALLAFEGRDAKTLSWGIWAIRFPQDLY
jgi:hypothetical protein